MTTFQIILLALALVAAPHLHVLMLRRRLERQLELAKNEFDAYAVSNDALIDSTQVVVNAGGVVVEELARSYRERAELERSRNDRLRKRLFRLECGTGYAEMPAPVMSGLVAWAVANALDELRLAEEGKPFNPEAGLPEAPNFRTFLATSLLVALHRIPGTWSTLGDGGLRQALQAAFPAWTEAEVEACFATAVKDLVALRAGYSIQGFDHWDTDPSLASARARLRGSRATVPPAVAS